MPPAPWPTSSGSVPGVPVCATAESGTADNTDSSTSVPARRNRREKKEGSVRTVDPLVGVVAAAQARQQLRESKFESTYLDWAKELRLRAYVEMREPPT